MVFGTLTPRGEALVELDRLAARVGELRARVDEIDREQRSASEEKLAAREALAEVERRAGGEGVTALERKKAESRLAEAERRSAEPWPSRLDGARRAVADADREMRVHAAEHLGAIVAELEENGQMAAERVNEAAAAFVRATEERAAAEARLISVVALTRRMDPNDVARSRTEQAVRQVSTLLLEGGEAAPVLRVEVVS
jgi:hypothetical protein